ncbi:MAG: hypothetical protein WD069_00870 [Planctomycetales bacterium]
MRAIYGRVRGRTIELDESPGFAEGQDVEVLVRPISAAGTIGEGLLRTEGALSDDPHWDAIMVEIHESRKHERRAMASAPRI